MALHTLPLKEVANIIVNLAARSAAGNAFNLALLMGEIPDGVEFGDARIKTYTTVNEMLEDGFKTTDRLYKAAALLMGQAKQPPKFAIGQAKKKNDTTTLEEPVDTLKACREEQGEWYAGIYCGTMTNDQILACAEYTESCEPHTIFCYTTQDEDCDKDGSGIFDLLKDKKYSRTFGQYSSTHQDAVAAIIGWAMGAMTGTVNSAFTLKFKSEVGVTTENADKAFPSSKVASIKAVNGNVYVNRGSYYDMFEEGTMANGDWFDERIFLDKYQNDMQLALMDEFVQNDKIAQTEAGMTQLKTVITAVCNEMADIGFIAAGTWQSKAILNLKYGDTLPNGYMVQSEAIADQSQADRDARKAPPIYVSLKLSGAIHSVTVEVDVNR